MTTTHATAENFWTAFQVLTRKEQQVVLQYIIQDKKFRRVLTELDHAKETTRSTRTHKKRGMTTCQLATFYRLGTMALGENMESQCHKIELSKLKTTSDASCRMKLRTISSMWTA